jgi:adenine-specific DNA-methyltransferase
MSKKQNAKFQELVAKLREIFQIDRPELDFGIYRILNARADEINDYLQNRLAEKVQDALAVGNAANTQQLQSELQEAEKNAQALGVNPDGVPKVQELRTRLKDASAGNFEYENAVFSHLLTFFSRYYQDGDFISQRRYKGDTYAIPYAGEEVMLHWANKDQYYTKSGENFSNYSFKLPEANGKPGRTVHFRLVSADTAKDNRKDNDKERRFALIERKIVTRIDEQGDEFDEEMVPVEEVDGANGKELIVRFAYKPVAKGNKQDALVEKAVAAVLADAAVKARWLDLGSRAPTEKNSQRTLLEKHLSDYTTKNTADYFIHKDLGGFLRRELDFYIKNEVMHLDDLQNASAFADIEKALRMIQCLRSISLEMIAFLAQLEDFQKKLWLKKKFVVSSHYCITLDRVPEALYSEIVANERQWAQWKQLGVCDSNAMGTLKALTDAPYRMVDTSLFDVSFSLRLISGFQNIDAEIDGLLIHGDNFQAMNLLKPKQNGHIDCIYIDPPYNTDASPIAYKNGFRSSSWTSLIYDRLKASKSLTKEDGMLCITIDDFQYRELSFISEEIFGSDSVLGTTTIRNNPAGRATKKGFAISHEYGLFIRVSPNTTLGFLPHTEDQTKRYKEKDLVGQFEWVNFRKHGGANANRSKRRTLYYPIYTDGTDVRIPKLEWDESTREWISLEPLRVGEIALLPVNEEGEEKTWKWEHQSVTDSLSEFSIRPDQSGKPYVYVKARINEHGTLPRTIWSDAKYSASEYGTNLLKDMFPGEQAFSFPKSVHAVEDTLMVLGMRTNQTSTVLDYFGGSGTTAHAVMNLNRDGGKRRYILVEQGEYFDVVTKARIQKVCYSNTWSSGKPIESKSGISHCFKVLKLESYEDTLNNLQLRRDAKQGETLSLLNQQAKDDYLLHYMLDVESRGSLLSVQDFKKPFNYTLNVAVDSAGAYEASKIDLVETFNYLIGLRVKHINAQPERGFVTVTGTLPSGETCLVLWRDCDMLDYEGVSKLCDKLAINPADNEFDVVYINGDHNIPTVLTQTAEEGGTTRVLKLRQIESEFLLHMFAVGDI